MLRVVTRVFCTESLTIQRGTIVIVKKRLGFLCLVTTSVILSFASCDESTKSVEDSGDIFINQMPDTLIGAVWTMSGTQSRTGSGDADYFEMPLGEYTVSWSDVSGYITPPSKTESLAADSLLLFSGWYMEVPLHGTIVIDQTPDVLTGAEWKLKRDIMFGMIYRGSGDTTLTDIIVSDYTLTWIPTSGYLAPPLETQTLEQDGTVTFSGAYTENPGPIGTFVLIPAGTFTMGSPTSEPSRDDDETQHSVTLTRSFEMFATEVTNQQYADLAQWAFDLGYCTASGSKVRDALDGSTEELLGMTTLQSEITFNSGTFQVDAGKESSPVLNVSWYGAVAYCDWLSLEAGLTRAYDHSTWSCNDNDPYNAAGYRLPTEAEWEYACRAGTQTPFFTGDCLAAGTEAHYNGTYPYNDCPSGPEIHGTASVGSYPVNEFNLFDMHGNLSEWCNDWLGVYGGDETDPVGVESGSYRVVRGGNSGGAQNCRSAYRGDGLPDITHYSSIGFRLVRSIN
jgi:formylglycine-generating enzyme required for sulfatase activity